MKKSELYRLAQEAVLDSELNNNIKLEILHTLMADENLALFSERQKGSEAGA